MDRKIERKVKALRRGRLPRESNPKGKAVYPSRLVGGGKGAELLKKALTLRQLRDRLTEIIRYHDQQGWSERNDQPVIMAIHQTETPKGRRRYPAHVPVMHASSGTLGIDVDESGRYKSTTELS